MNKNITQWVKENCKFAAPYNRLLETPAPEQPADTPWMQKKHPTPDSSIAKLISIVDKLHYDTHVARFDLNDAMKKNDAVQIKPLQDQLKAKIPLLLKGMLKLVRRMDEISLANYEKPYPDLNLFYQKLGDVQKGLTSAVSPDQISKIEEVIETLYVKLMADAKGIHILNKEVFPNNEAFKDVAPPTDLKHNPSDVGDTGKLYTHDTPLPQYVRVKP